MKQYWILPGLIVLILACVISIAGSMVQDLNCGMIEGDVAIHPQFGTVVTDAEGAQWVWNTEPGDLPFAFLNPQYLVPLYAEEHGIMEDGQ